MDLIQNFCHHLNFATYHQLSKKVKKLLYNEALAIIKIGIVNKSYETAHKMINFILTEFRPKLSGTPTIKTKVKDKKLEKFLGSSDFEIQRNEGAGDCFFASIRDAYLYISRIISVKTLRELTAANINVSVFDNYRLLYDQFLQAKDAYDSGLKKLNQNLKAKVITKLEFTKLKSKFVKDYTSVQDVYASVMAMKNIHTMEQFRDHVKTSLYWADESAIAVLERTLNVKFIILQNYGGKYAFYYNLMDQKLIQKGNFEPTFYILVKKFGGHFELILYNNIGIFTWEQLPDVVKEFYTCGKQFGSTAVGTK
jgi:hypothetical protein